MKSNLEHWKALQADGYFDKHLCYRDAHGNLSGFSEDDHIIARFLPLEGNARVAVIGCGFGRDAAAIAPKVGHVWGIDVSPALLDRAVTFVAARGLNNFTPVLAERWKEDLPGDLNLVYSVVVFQHLTRDLVRDYVCHMPTKLAPDGHMLCQFADTVYGTDDVDLTRPYEPSVRWNRRDIEELATEANLRLKRLERQEIPDHGDWWWALFAAR
uniref:Cyclopropane-fatty-acyl-phospholipid synthase n=1 Tax=Desulfovibrio sp. U5L TaxID=596152 RepID=I2Q7M2_9BACT